MIARAREMMARALDMGRNWLLKDPRYWPQMDGGSRKTVSSEWIGEESALKWSAVWCATQLYCGIGGSLPLPIYRGLDDERREKVRQHPLYRLLNVSPNPEQTAFAFRSVMWQWQVNWGNAYAEIEREGNTPDAPIVNLWPIHPDRVKPARDEQQTLYYEVRDEAKHTWNDVDAWRIWHIPSILTSDGIVGRGVVANARETIGAGVAGEKKAAHAYGAGNLPRIVVKHPQKLDDTQRAAFRKEWHDLYDTPTGENMAYLGGGADVTALGFNNVDSQFIESRGFGIEDIARWYNLPPHMLKRLVNSTYNNIELLGTEFVRYTLVPWLEMWEQSIALRLFGERERKRYFAEHNVDALLRGDAQSRATFYHQAINDGWMNRNEVRKLENLDPVPGGDTFVMQGAMVPLDETGMPPQPETAAKAPPPDVQKSDDANARHAAAFAGFARKEAMAISNMAAKSKNFVADVDEFLRRHSFRVSESYGPALTASWVSECKRLVLDAAGEAKTTEELMDAVARLVESKAWAERPERIVEGLAA